MVERTSLFFLPRETNSYGGWWSNGGIEGWMEGERARASVLQRVIVRGQRWQKMSSTQWLIPDPMWFMAPPRLFCRSLWCHITQAVQTASLISVLVNRKGGHTCVATVKMKMFCFEFTLCLSRHQTKWIVKIWRGSFENVWLIEMDVIEITCRHTGTDAQREVNENSDGF